MSLIKAAGGIAGFVAVLLVHQLVVSRTADSEWVLTDESGPVGVQTDGRPVQPESVLLSTAPEVSGDSAVDTVLNTQPSASEEHSEGAGLSTIDEQTALKSTQQEIEEPMLPASQSDSEPVQPSLPELALLANELPTEVVPSAAVSTSSERAESFNHNPLASPMQWSAVWRPFFSPATAQGFADYIAESTGLTLRVQQSSVAGHYLVEVQHRTEAERIDADRRIVETTGYKPPGAVQ